MSDVAPEHFAAVMDFKKFQRAITPTRSRFSSTPPPSKTASPDYLRSPPPAPPRNRIIRRLRFSTDSLTLQKHPSPITLATAITFSRTMCLALYKGLEPQSGLQAIGFRALFDKLYVAHTLFDCMVHLSGHETGLFELAISCAREVRAALPETADGRSTEEEEKEKAELRRRMKAAASSAGFYSAHNIFATIEQLMQIEACDVHVSPLVPVRVNLAGGGSVCLFSIEHFRGVKLSRFMTTFQAFFRIYEAICGADDPLDMFGSPGGSIAQLLGRHHSTGMDHPVGLL